MYIVMAETGTSREQVYGPDTEAACVLYMQHQKSKQELLFGRIPIVYYMKEYKEKDNNATDKR